MSSLLCFQNCIVFSKMLHCIQSTSQISSTLKCLPYTSLCFIKTKSFECYYWWCLFKKVILHLMFRAYYWNLLLNLDVKISSCWINIDKMVKSRQFFKQTLKFKQFYSLFFLTLTLQQILWLHRFQFFQFESKAFRQWKKFLPLVVENVGGHLRLLKLWCNLYQWKKSLTIKNFGISISVGSGTPTSFTPRMVLILLSISNG